MSQFTDDLGDDPRPNTYTPDDEPVSQSEIYQAARQQLIADGLSAAAADEQAALEARLAAEHAAVRRGAKLAQQAARDAAAEKARTDALVAAGNAGSQEYAAVDAAVAAASTGIVPNIEVSVQDQFLAKLRAIPGAVADSPGGPDGPNSANILEVR